MLGEIEKKYNIFYDKYGMHYYTLDLKTKYYNLESTSPYIFKYESFIFENCNSWNILLLNLFNYFYRLNEIDDETFLSYKIDWSSQIIFSKDGCIGTWIGPTQNNLYINNNFGLNNLYFILLELLKIFKADITKATFIIKRSPNTEPIEVKDYFYKDNKMKFKMFLREEKQMNEEQINKCINNYEIISGMFSKFNKIYENLFLFQSSNQYILIKQRFLEYLINYTSGTIEDITRYNKYIEILKEFYLKQYNF